MIDKNLLNGGIHCSEIMIETEEMRNKRYRYETGLWPK
jgi:hypothetical protein